MVADPIFNILGHIVLEKTAEWSKKFWPFRRERSWTIETSYVHVAGTDGDEYLKGVQTELINSGLNDASIVLHESLLSEVLKGPFNEVYGLLKQAQIQINSPLTEVKAVA